MIFYVRLLRTDGLSILPWPRRQVIEISRDKARATRNSGTFNIIASDWLIAMSSSQT